MTYTEPYRPQYHFSPQTGWMNDPNGLVYYAGEYHLFYQYHPYSTIWGPMHWGHAVSRDLVHWEPLPIALTPDDIGTIFSGSAVVDETGRLAALFSYDNQSQGIAFSSNKGRTWTKYADNPIIPSPHSDFRDPKVFWDAERGQWVMVLAAGDRLRLYTSTDLIHWTFASEFTNSISVGVWECPDLFPLEFDGQTKWILIVNVGDKAIAGGSGTLYFVGNFDGQTFTAETSSQWFDYGPDNYAGVTWNHTPDGKRILIGWMNNWQYAKAIPTSIWCGAMTIPRLLSLTNRNGWRLVQQPIPQLEMLRGTAKTWTDVMIDGSQSLGKQGRMLEVLAEFELMTATEFGLRVRKNGSQFAAVGYHTVKRAILVDRTASGWTHEQQIFTAPLDPIDNRISLHLFIDWSSVEVFGNDGLVAITCQIFPDQDGQEIELYTNNGDVRLVTLTVYHLKSIWDTNT